MIRQRWCACDWRETRVKFFVKPLSGSVFSGDKVVLGINGVGDIIYQFHARWENSQGQGGIAEGAPRVKRGIPPVPTRGA